MYVCKIKKLHDFPMAYKPVFMRRDSSPINAQNQERHLECKILLQRLMKYITKQSKLSLSLLH